RYFNEISIDSGKFCFGVESTLLALEAGAVDILIVWENLEIIRFKLKKHSNTENVYIHIRPDQESNKKYFVDPDTGIEMEIAERVLFLDWLSENYKDFGYFLFLRLNVT
ncbi:hypothetical protein A3Q56_07917, partial [Intoshia linei]